MTAEPLVISPKSYGARSKHLFFLTFEDAGWMMSQQLASTATMSSRLNGPGLFWPPQRAYSFG